MKQSIINQGNQASKLLPEIYELLESRGIATARIYNVHLSDDELVLLNSNSDITVNADELVKDYDIIKISSGLTEYVLRKSLTYDNSAVFYAIISDSLKILIGYVTSNSIHLKFEHLGLQQKDFAITLEIGDSESVKEANIEKLKGTHSHFFCSIDFGYGVGTFKDTIGGFAHVTNAYGNEVFYDISSDGAIKRNTLYVKPNEPYSVILKAEEIGISLDDIKASKISQAGELIIYGSTGPITYTRTADSTEAAIYFTDTRKDGKLAVLSYSVSTKTITASII